MSSSTRVGARSAAFAGVGEDGEGEVIGVVGWKDHIVLSVSNTDASVADAYTAKVSYDKTSYYTKISHRYTLIRQSSHSADEALLNTHEPDCQLVIAFPRLAFLLPRLRCQISRPRAQRDEMVVVIHTCHEVV